jgi:hypothetical protein
MFRTWIGVVLLVAVISTVSRGQQAATTQAAAKQSSEGKLKMGILVSEFTATGPHAGAQPYGYAHAAIAGEMKDDSIVLIPVIDPGSESEAGLAEAIKENFPESEGKVLNGGDAEALKSLDVIVLAAVPNLKDEVIDAVSGVVSEGMPLLVVGRCGNLNPGYKNPKIAELVGMSSARFGWTRGQGKAQVVAKDDSLIKDLGAEELTLSVAGGHGTLKDGATPIMKLASGVELRLPGDQTKGEDEEYLVMYQTKLAKGPVLVCNWAKLPEQLATLEGEPFYVRCVKRLVEAKKNPAAAK